MSAFEFGLSIPPIVVVPGFTIPEICLPIPYPCPTWSNPFRWCTTTVCTPEIVVPPIGWGGLEIGFGPLWSTSIPIGGFEYDWFDVVGVQEFDHLQREAHERQSLLFRVHFNSTTKL